MSPSGLILMGCFCVRSDDKAEAVRREVGGDVIGMKWNDVSALLCFALYTLAGSCRFLLIG
jgi:hypothetical protein